MGMGCQRDFTNNQNVLLLATLASIRISQGLTTGQIETLAAFFDVLANNLALLIAPPCLETSENIMEEDN